jgi:hypothetical protein
MMSFSTTGRTRVSATAARAAVCEGCGTNGVLAQTKRSVERRAESAATAAFIHSHICWPDRPGSRQRRSAAALSTYALGQLGAGGGGRTRRGDVAATLCGSIQHPSSSCWGPRGRQELDQRQPPGGGTPAAATTRRRRFSSLAPCIRGCHCPLVASNSDCALPSFTAADECRKVTVCISVSGQLSRRRSN